MSDIGTVLAAVANIVVSLVRLMLPGRPVAPTLGRWDAQLQARALALAIHPVDTLPASLHLVSDQPK